MRDRRLTMYLLAPMCAFILVAVMAASREPLGRVVGYDFAVYVSAAHVVTNDGNPYDAHAVWAVERELQGLGSRAPDVTLARVAEPPVLFWALQPLAALPFQRAILIGEMVSLMSVVAGLLLLLQAFGWRRSGLALLAGLVLPPTFQYVYEGNVGVLIFAGLALGLLVARRYPVVAGIALSLAICKPQVALPLAGLVILFHAGSRFRALAGFAVGAAVVLAASAIATGPQSLLWWLRGFVSFGRTLVHQPQVASLSALYVGRVPPHVSLLLTAGLLLLAGVATALTFWHVHDAGPMPVRSLAWLWLLWFLVAPYDHFNDYLFLAPVLLSFLATPERSDRLRAISLLYAASFVWLPGGTYLGLVILFGVLVSLFWWIRQPSPQVLLTSSLAPNVLHSSDNTAHAGR